MEKIVTKRKRGWFWVGVILLFFCALFWLQPVFMLIAEEAGPVEAIAMGVFFTAFPIGLAIICLMQRSPSLERSPWGSGTLWAVAILGGFAVGGIIAGLNWRRMGRNRLMWPTMIIPIVPYFIWLYVAYFIWVYLPWPESAMITQGITTLLSIGFAWSVWQWQKGPYSDWQVLHPEAYRAGWQIPVLLVVVIDVCVLSLLFS